jgi:hypothetical protein
MAEPSGLGVQPASARPPGPTLLVLCAALGAGRGSGLRCWFRLSSEGTARRHGKQAEGPGIEMDVGREMGGMVVV